MPSLHRFNEDNIKQISDIMKQRFPAYTYINLDSGWYAKFKLGCHDRLQPLY